MKLGAMLLIVGSASLAACGGGSTTGTSGTTSGNGGSSAQTSTSTSASTGGTGGAGGDAAGSGGSGGGTPCESATLFFDVVGDGPLQHHDAGCHPTGALFHGGGGKPPPPPKPPQPIGGELGVNACPQPSGSLIAVDGSSAVWPGMTTTGHVQYQRGGVLYQDSPFGSGTLVVTTFGAVGTIIEGSFSAGVTPQQQPDAGPPIALSGTFRACRGPDPVAP